MFEVSWGECFALYHTWWCCRLFSISELLLYYPMKLMLHTKLLLLLTTNMLYERYSIQQLIINRFISCGLMMRSLWALSKGAQISSKIHSIGGFNQWYIHFEHMKHNRNTRYIWPNLIVFRYLGNNCSLTTVVSMLYIWRYNMWKSQQ